MPSSVSRRITPPPSLMGRSKFVARFGDIYEHSPWVAERLWDLGLSGQHDLVDGLCEGMRSVVANASREEKIALLRAHPDLAGKAAVGSEPTAAAGEQTRAGLDQCTKEEFDRFQSLSAAYRAKFGFPFVIAVEGLDRAAIIDAFKRRINKAPKAELDEALDQIDRIARLRIEALADGGGAHVRHP